MLHNGAEIAVGRLKMDDGVVVVAHVDAFLALFILFRDGVRQLAEHLKPFLSFLTSRNVDAALRLQANDKVSSFAELALHADCSSAGLDDVMADAEAKTDSLFVSVGRVLQLAEVEEKLLLVFLGDSAASVAEYDVKTDHLLNEAVFAAHRLQAFNLCFLCWVFLVSDCLDRFVFSITLRGLFGFLFFSERWEVTDVGDFEDDGDCAAAWGELNPIGQEVEDDLGVAPRVSVDRLEEELVHGVGEDGAEEHDPSLGALQLEGTLAFGHD